ncbi:hypothetical protein [Aliikangiella sp. IMCC44359]|uniref:hypothetical protein n=1 Tax=Aliikangiella sp. IMCC44359 TaxID=3459125 RepID=UPI00403ADDDB
MRVLLELPGKVLKENLSGYKEVISFYKNKDWYSLENVIVTKDFSGEVKSYFGDFEWDLSAYVDRKITHKTKLNFSNILSEKLVREMKLICFIWMYIAGNSRNSQPIKPTSLMERHSRLIQVYKYLDLHEYQSIEDLSHPIIFSEFCQYIQDLRYSYSTASHTFGVLNHLNRARDLLPFKFTFPTDQSTEQLAREHASIDKLCKDQFYAIPTRIMELIYSEAISLVKKVHPHKELVHELLFELHKNYQLGKSYVDNKIESGQWKWITKESQDYRIEVNKHKPDKYSDIIEAYIEGTSLETEIPRHTGRFQGWVTKVQTACFVLCAAFTGMRRNELYGLHPDSFKRKSMGSQTFYSLQSFHHKMVQGKAQRTEWLTIPLCKDAIELAEAISRHMRNQLLVDEDPMKANIASCLWLNQANKSKPPNVRFEGSLRTHFNKIATDANAFIKDEDLEEFKLINPNNNPLHADRKLKIGSLWPITTHQFRRTFAVFAKRHSLCSDVAIKQQFKHLDLPTSEWYGEGGVAAKLKEIEFDSELNKLLNEVQHEITTQKVYNWYNTSEKLYGKAGLSIAKERKNDAQIYSSWDAIHEHVTSGKITLVGTLHSYCLAGYECRMNKVTSPVNCFKCENVLIDEEKSLNWSKRHKWVTEQLIYLERTNSLSKSAYSHFITQLKAAEKVMKHFEIPHQPYQSNK